MNVFPNNIGQNPAFGHDIGPPPPFAPYAAVPRPPDFGPPPPGTMLSYPPAYYPMPSTLPAQRPMMYYYPPTYPPPPYTAAAAIQHPPGFGFGTGTAIAADRNGQLYQYISGLHGSNRFPQPAPPVDPDFPAANLLNASGGAGAEPGFNYFFPTDHAKVIVLKCPVKPWTLVPGSYGDIPFKASLIPANVTMAELLVGFGADHPDKKMNQFWEVYPQGGGAWGWKEHCTGDDEIMMARTVRDMGWVEKREGRIETVYLWISKNGGV